MDTQSNATVERVKNDYLKWGRVVKEANIRAD